MVIDATDELVRAMVWSHAGAVASRASMDAGAFGHHTALVTMLAHHDLNHPCTGLEGSDRVASITEHLTHYADLAARAADVGPGRAGARHRRRADTFV